LKADREYAIKLFGKIVSCNAKHKTINLRLVKNDVVEPIRFTIVLNDEWGDDICKDAFILFSSISVKVGLETPQGILAYYPMIDVTTLTTASREYIIKSCLCWE
jgi:hypothetical protein